MIINNIKYLYTDKKIIQDILSTSTHANNLALDSLYNRFYVVIQRFIIANKGTEEEAKDVFQEAIITLYENIKNGKFEQKSSIKTYLYSTGKYLWFNELKKKKKMQLTELNNETTTSGDFADFNDKQPDQDTQLIALLARMGDTCRNILTMYYYKKLSMKEIAYQLNFGSPESAKVQKNKCMNKLKNMLEGMSELREDILSNRYRVENI